MRRLKLQHSSLRRRQTEFHGTRQKGARRTALRAAQPRTRPTSVPPLPTPLTTASTRWPGICSRSRARFRSLVGTRRFPGSRTAGAGSPVLCRSRFRIPDAPGNLFRLRRRNRWCRHKRGSSVSLSLLTTFGNDGDEFQTELTEEAHGDAGGPLDASTTVPPGCNRPCSNARPMMYRAILSLVEPLGFRNRISTRSPAHLPTIGWNERSGREFGRVPVQHGDFEGTRLANGVGIEEAAAHLSPGLRPADGGCRAVFVPDRGELKITIDEALCCMCNLAGRAGCGPASGGGPQGGGLGSSRRPSLRWSSLFRKSGSRSIPRK